MWVVSALSSVHMNLTSFLFSQSELVVWIVSALLSVHPSRWNIALSSPLSAMFQAKKGGAGTHAAGNQSADGIAAPPGGQPAASDAAAEGEASPDTGDPACK